MKAVLKTIFLSVLLSVWTILPVSAAEETFDRNGNGNVTRGEVRRELRSGDVDLTKTCLDEYGRRSRNLALLAGFTPPVTAGVGVGATYGVILGTGAATVGTYGLGAIFLALFAGILAIGAFAVGLVTFETLHLVRLVRNNKLIKFIAEAHEKKGKTIAKHFKRFVNQYRSHRGTLTLEKFSDAVVAADESGALCDGSLRGRSANSKLSKRLAAKKDIYRFVNAQLLAQ